MSRKKLYQFKLYFQFVFAIIAINGCTKQIQLSSYEGINPPRIALHATSIQIETPSSESSSPFSDVSLITPLKELLTAGFSANDQGEPLFIVIEKAEFTTEPEQLFSKTMGLFSPNPSQYYRVHYKVRLEARDKHGFAQQCIMTHTSHAKLVPARASLAERRLVLTHVSHQAAITLYQQLLHDLRTPTLPWLPQAL